ncbi:MAG: methylenetetrahydrofolate reductase [Elusimicrobia bacterium]|nr:methylenetetrahydrofolate reductase [Candidatus Liberimonas magnetica]
MTSKLCQKLKSNEFIITAELFPPKGVDVEDLLRRADLIGSLVDGINVTDNQRASMRLGSLATCRLLKEKGYEPILQMACRDRNRIALQSDLLSAYVLGIENVLIISGDHNSIGEYKDAKPVYDLDSTQLLKAARTLESGVDMAGKKLKGSPRFCLGAVVNPTADPIELQIMMMEKKINAGAVFFQTQPVYDIEQYKIFLEKTKHLNTKIMPGVILLKSAQFIKIMAGLPGVNIPKAAVERIEKAKDPLKEGINICAEMIRELRKCADGVHIMAIGLEEYIPEILEKSK